MHVLEVYFEDYASDGVNIINFLLCLNRDFVCLHFHALGNSSSITPFIPIKKCLNLKFRCGFVDGLISGIHLLKYHIEF